MTTAEKALLLSEIEARVAVPVASPYSIFVRTRTMAALLVALAIVLGTSGTVLASEQAKPGDTLFPVDRATEKIRLALASTEVRVRLQAQFNEERLAELREIIEEERAVDNTSASSTTNAIIVVNDDGEARIGAAVQVLLNYIEDTDESVNREAFLSALLRQVDAVKVAGRLEGANSASDDKARIQIKDNRIEVREDGYRVRIDDDGEIRIKLDDDRAEGGHRSDDDEEDDDDDQDSATFEAEADVFFDTTLIEVEINDHKSTFETTANTKEEVIVEISARYNLERSVVESGLNFEIEDRASRNQDAKRDDSQDEEWHDSGDDDDDDHDDGDDDHEDDGEAARIEKFEVRVEGMTAQVQVEYGDDEKLEYETLYTTKAALIAEVALQTGLATANLAAALDLEIE